MGVVPYTIQLQSVGGGGGVGTIQLQSVGGGGGGGTIQLQSVGRGGGGTIQLQSVGGGGGTIQLKSVGGGGGTIQLQSVGGGWYHTVAVSGEGGGGGTILWGYYTPSPLTLLSITLNLFRHRDRSVFKALDITPASILA